MPPELVPVFLFLAEDVTVVFLCLTVPLPPVLGAMALVGDRPTDPTEVALGAAGIVRLFLSTIRKNAERFVQGTPRIQFVVGIYKYLSDACVLEISRKIRIVADRNA